MPVIRVYEHRFKRANEVGGPISLNSGLNVMKRDTDCQTEPLLHLQIKIRLASDQYIFNTEYAKCGADCQRKWSLKSLISISTPSLAARD